METENLLVQDKLDKKIEEYKLLEYEFNLIKKG